MKRRMLVALAIALTCPAVAVAQEEPAPPSRLTITPFLGYAFAYTQKGTVEFTDVKGSYTANYQRQVQGGMMPGVDVELRAPGRFGLSAGLAYNRRGDESLSTDFVDLAPMYSSGSTMWFLRGAVTMELMEDSDMRLAQPKAEVRVGPTMVREIPDAFTGRPATNAWGINAAATAELPLPWKGFAARGTFEDCVAYLPKGDVGVQLGMDVSSQIGRPMVAQLSGGPTHLYAVQLGLAYHF